MIQHSYAADADVAVESPVLSHSILERNELENAPANAPITGSALVVRADLRTDRSNRPYVAMTLQCAGGTTIEARWWHFPHTPDDCPLQGEVYLITGRVDVFNGERQLRITSTEHLPEADLSVFIKATRRTLPALLDELNEVYASLDDQMLALVQTVLCDAVFDDFCIWPAAHHRHGAVRHGLLAHSVRVAELVQRIADAYGMNGLEYDQPLAVAAALLHDIGKLRTLPAIAGAALPATAELYDHVTLSVLAVQHAAHQLAIRVDWSAGSGSRGAATSGWGGKSTPSTVESLGVVSSANWSLVMVVIVYTRF